MTNCDNLLFLCTGNSARSLMAEAILNHYAGERYRAYSAGSHPTGMPNPLAIQALKKRAVSTENLRSKSWDLYGEPDAPKFRLVVTMCDDAASETCPIWLGSPLRAHWGLADPAKFEGSATMMEAAFDEAFSTIERRIRAFLAHPEFPEDSETLANIGKLR